MQQIPKSKIVEIITPLALRKRGDKVTVKRQCGHFDSVSKADARIGKSDFCFDCYYNKPVI